MPSICFVAGDPSGDAHAARLITTLKARRADLSISALGGPAMRSAGATLLDELTAAASIGPFDAARHLSRFVRARRLLEAHLASTRPDLVILVDFGDFNLPVIAPLVHRHRVPIVYYISPQVWAWGGFRVRYVQRYVRRMLVFFRFEEAFYHQAGIAATWVGHPLLDTASPGISREALANRLALNPWRMTVGLLPGSRPGEVQRHLPVMLAAAQRIGWQMPGVQFLLLKAPGLLPSRFDRLAADARVDLRVAGSLAADALQLMDAAMVASGTATLETALARVPMAVLYRTSWPTYLAARAVVRVPHIAMVNLVAGREVVPEFVQHRARPRLIAEAVIRLLRDEPARNTMLEGLREVGERLGPRGAVDRAADAVLNELPIAQPS